METTRDEVEYVIEALRNNFEIKYNKNSINHFLYGNCYIFATVLKEIFDEGQIMYNKEHVVFCIDNELYDVRYSITLEDLENFGGHNLIAVNDEEDLYYCDIIFTPDNKKESKEVLEFLIPIGIKARENYRENYKKK